MNNRRLWVCVFLFALTTNNYTYRVALSVTAKPVSIEFCLTPVEMGYLFSSFLWMYIYPDSPGTRETPLPGVATRILPSA
jgi:ACS family glucarate transporter-like MFS transporter